MKIEMIENFSTTSIQVCTRHNFIKELWYTRAAEALKNRWEGRPNLTLFQPWGPNLPDWTQKLVWVWSHYIGRIPNVQPKYNWFRRPCYMKEWLLKMYDLWFHGRNAGQSVPKIGCKLIGGFDFKPKPLGGRCRDH